MKGKRISATLLTALITTVLLLAALSTATFAWFTSNSTVNLTDFLFVAQKGSNDASGNLFLSWSRDSDWQNSLSFGAESGDGSGQVTDAYDLYEGIPVNEPYIGMPYSEFSQFNSANTYAVAQRDGTVKNYYFKDGQRYVPASCYNKNDSSLEWFYIKNESAGGVDVTLSCEFEGTISPAIRIAVFVDDALAGVLGLDGSSDGTAKKLYYGTIEKDALVEETPSASIGSEVVFHMDGKTDSAESVRKIRLVPWLCGVTVDDSYRNNTGRAVNVIFSGEYIA